MPCRQFLFSLMKTVVVNPLRHSVSGANTHTENSQLLKDILYDYPEILYDFYTFIICLQIAFTVLGIGLF